MCFLRGGILKAGYCSVGNINVDSIKAGKTRTDGSDEPEAMGLLLKVRQVP